MEASRVVLDSPSTYRSKCQCQAVSVRHAERLDFRFKNWLQRIDDNDQAFITAHLSLDVRKIRMYAHNTPLTNAGVRQAHITAMELVRQLTPKPDKVLLLSSPLLRYVFQAPTNPIPLDVRSHQH
jgi:broad specificity phosphatase PhoE